MKKNKPYYLKYYKEWAVTGLPQVSPYHHGGLCGAGLWNDVRLHLFEPIYEERIKYGLTPYWADGLGLGAYDRPFAFTPLRQTIVLFLAAINEEL